MNVRTTLAIATFIITATAATARAEEIVSVKRINLLHNQTRSPFFTSNDTGSVGLLPFLQTDANTNITFTPQGSVQAGQVSSLISNGSFSIAGTSTSVGNWTDGNGIPAGITLTFNTQFEVRVGTAGAGSPPDSYLTTAGSTGPTLGNGLGIAQGLGNVDTMDSGNLTTPINGAYNESLEVSAMSVSGVSFTGTLAEPGYTFTGGTVGNFGPYVLRSNGWMAINETMVLIPEGSTTPTIGFGTPSDHPSEVGRGEGSVASHVFINDNFSNGAPTAPNYFPRQIGGYSLLMQNGTIAIKGIGYEYDVAFDITADAPENPGDFNHDGSVDAADYVAWRKGFGTEFEEVDYQEWVENFGQTYPGGGSGGSVPEPAAITLFLFGLAAIGSRRFLR